MVMNPVRQRIFQYFLLHEAGTVKELKRALPNVPNASLYRHIKILAEHSILTVVGENRIRGTVESVYQLNKEALATEDEGGNAVQMSLRDMLGVLNSWLVRRALHTFTLQLQMPNIFCSPSMLVI